MPTDVSSFNKTYKTAKPADFPLNAEIVLGDQHYRFMAIPVKLRYGTNPHQPFAAYVPVDSTLSIGNMEMLKEGKDGMSLTNLQDMSQALNILKYFDGQDACVAMKHINPCGFKVRTDSSMTLADIYRQARKCDELSHFGSVVGLNYIVDEATAEAVMETFVECLVAPGYTQEALEVLMGTERKTKLNKSIRIAKVSNIDKLPKFIGDDVTGLYNFRTLVDGTLTLETPYLTRIKSVDDFVIDPMIPNSDPSKNDGKNYVVETMPTEQQLADCLIAWYLNINVRSNGIVFVKDGMALSVGTGQQNRIEAVEQAIYKAKQRGHSLEGSVMSSDGFFPQSDCIEAAARVGVGAVVWPAGSMNDYRVLEAANKYGMALIVTLERCFLHI